MFGLVCLCTVIIFTEILSIDSCFYYDTLSKKMTETLESMMRAMYLAMVTEKSSTYDEKRLKCCQYFYVSLNFSHIFSFVYSICTYYRFSINLECNYDVTDARDTLLIWGRY